MSLSERLLRQFYSLIMEYFSFVTLMSMRSEPMPPLRLYWLKRRTDLMLSNNSEGEVSSFVPLVPIEFL